MWPCGFAMTHRPPTSCIWSLETGLPPTPSMWVSDRGWAADPGQLWAGSRQERATGGEIVSSVRQQTRGHFQEEATEWGLLLPGAGRRRPGQGCPKSLPLCPGPQQQPPSAKPGTFYSGAPQQNSCLFVTPKRQRPQYPSVAGKAGAEGGCQETRVQRQPCEETGRDEREEGYPRQTLKSSRGGWQAPASSLTMPAHR